MNIKSKTPIVSVIIPTYNRANLLSRAIKSALSQTFQDFELIIVDDGSTDNTKEVVEKFKKKDNRVKYIWQENSGGPASPKNKGIKASKGEYIAFLDDDDEWFPEKIEKQLEIFENSKDKNIGIVACNALDVFEDSKTIKEYKIKETKEEKYLPMILNGCLIHSSSSVVVKKNIFKKVGYFDKKLKTADDYDMWIKILSKYNFDFYPHPLFKYYIHGKNISFNESISLKKEQKCIILKKHKDLYDKYPKIYSNKLRYIGNRYIMLGKKRKARKILIKSIKNNPLNFRTYFSFLLSFLNVCIINYFYKRKRKI